MEYAIKLENISKIYKLYKKPLDRLLDTLNIKKSNTTTYQALNDVNIEFKKGDSIGILGTNGAGKSTLLKIITGVVTPTSGERDVNGTIAAMLELNAGFDNQLTGLENIYLKGTLLGFSDKEMESRLEDIKNFADLGEHLIQPVRTYSSGMKSRLGFSVAVHTNPDILIIDEALAVGDEAFRLKCLNKIKDFKEANKTILFVSHSLAQVRSFCNKAVWLQKGTVKEYGDVKTVTASYENFLKEQKSTLAKKKAPSKEPQTKADYVERTAFSFFHNNGKHNRTFKEGESVNFNVGFNVKRELEGATFHWALLDSERKELFSTLHAGEGYSLSRKEGHFGINVQLDTPSLMTGRYLVVTLVRDSSGLLEFILSTAQHFDVKSENTTGHGIIRIPHTIVEHDDTEQIINSDD